MIKSIGKIIVGLLIALSLTVSYSSTYPTVVVQKDFEISVKDTLNQDELQFAATEVASISSQAELGDKKAEFKLSLIPTVEKSAESVNLEKEGIPSKVLTLYDNSQKKLVDVTHPVPILDTINEHEKYGNHGDMFDGISRAIVNGYEAFSNLLNTLIQKPKELQRSISKGITAQLDILGGKLVGL